MSLNTEIYYKEKPQGDVDLIDVVRNILIRAGLAKQVEHSFDTHPLIIGSQNKLSSVQRFNLNRYWSLQLMSVNDHSEEERYCLIPNGSNEDWISLFTDKVLPFVITHSLPKAIH